MKENPPGKIWWAGGVGKEQLVTAHSFIPEEKEDQRMVREGGKEALKDVELGPPGDRLEGRSQPV